MKPEYPVVVIGAGPTGVATLFYAAVEAMPAIGVEAASHPLPDVHSYMHGLTLASPSDHFEVAGLPLDCRNRFQLTREDVLSYYTRLIGYGNLDIRCRQRCIGITFAARKPVVHVETPHGQESWFASNVLITSWARRRPVPESWLGHGPTVVGRIDDVSRYAGKRIAIVGGGLSGYEHAVALMLSGQRVTVVARRKLHSAFRYPAVLRLAESTCSNFIECASGIAVDDAGVRFRLGDSERVVPCDTVVACLGREICPDTTQLLLSAGVIDEDVAAAVQRAVLETPGNDTDTSKVRESLANWPDLWRQLVVGFQGVRIIGNGLHLGAAGAGVGMATLSGFLAIQAILGRKFPNYLTPPLPASLFRAAVQRLPETFHWFLGQRDVAPEPIGQIRPLAIQSWSRAAIIPPRRDASFSGAASYLLGQSDWPMGHLVDLLRRCDGTRSVDALAREEGSARDVLVQRLRKLWANNALTWLPPSDGLRCVPQVPKNEHLDPNSVDGGSLAQMS